MEYELMHYGVKGMKWGVRRAEKRAARADRNIARAEARRKVNKILKDESDADARYRYSSPRKAKRLQNKLAVNKATYDISESANKFFIARNKAKKDPSYKQSKEYMTAKKEYGRNVTNAFLYGDNGAIRIESLKNRGYQEKQAKGRVLAEQWSAAVVAGIIGTALASQTMKK